MAARQVGETADAPAAWEPRVMEDDDERLADLARVEPEKLKHRPVLESLATLLSDIFQIDNGGISIVDERVEYFLANSLGLNGEGARSEAYCAHTIQSDDLFVIEDAAEDDVFRHHPKYAEDGVRFYAGAPIAGPEGHMIGALCIRDTSARTLEAGERSILRQLAQIASHILQTELDNVRLTERTAELTGAINDIRRLQDEVLEARKLEALGTLTAGVAHELNTPAQFIGDNLQFITDGIGPLFAAIDDIIGPILDTESGPSVRARLDEADYDFLRGEVPQALSQSADGVDHIARIVRSLKEYAHPGASESVASDLNRAVENATVVSRSSWKTQADLELDLDPELPHVMCRIGEINQVVVNLIVNAADAIAETGTRGTITVSTRIEDGHAVLSIADDGPGIPTELQPRIFDPFFTTKQVGKGTGQGLPISQRIAETHGGSLRFETEEGVGTVFSLRLPVQNTD